MRQVSKSAMQRGSKSARRQVSEAAIRQVSEAASQRGSKSAMQRFRGSAIQRLSGASAVRGRSREFSFGADATPGERATDGSPRRKPWVQGRFTPRAPEGAQENNHKTVGFLRDASPGKRRGTDATSCSDTLRFRFCIETPDEEPFSFAGPYHAGTIKFVANVHSADSLTRTS